MSTNVGTQQAQFNNGYVKIQAKFENEEEEEERSHYQCKRKKRDFG